MVETHNEHEPTCQASSAAASWMLGREDLTCGLLLGLPAAAPGIGQCTCRAQCFCFGHYPTKKHPLFPILLQKIYQTIYQTIGKILGGVALVSAPAGHEGQQCLYILKETWRLLIQPCAAMHALHAQR